MNIIRSLIELIFSLAVIINAALFIPQALRILRRKSAEDISFITFAGFNLIQVAFILHGYIQKDYLLMYGILLCFFTSGTVTVLTIYYRHKTHKARQKKLIR